MVENSGNVLQKLSARSKTSLENFFYRWGFAVATHPGKFVSICLLTTVLFGSGIILIKEESRPDKLILPATAEYAVNTEWIRSKVPVPLRENYAGIVADNVLTPEVMKVLIDLHEKVKSVSTRDGKTWSDVCFRVPVTKIDLGEESLRRKRREANNSEAAITTTASSSSQNDWDSAFDDDFFKESSEEDGKPKQWTVYHSIPESLYCSIIDTLDEACLESNPIELWSYDKDVIYNLTQEEIIRVFNHEIISPVFGRKTKYKMELGGKIEKNEKGEIIKAESLLMTWDVKVDTTQEMITDTQGLVGDAAGLEWEKAWIQAMKRFAKEMPSGIKLHFLNAACWGDILDETLIQEGIILVCGFGIMFLYVAMMLGKPNMIEQRPFLTLAGLGSIAFSLIIGCGFCAFLSQPFLTLNRVMPFLILGIGIDDMFVIMQCFNNLSQHDALKKTKMGTIPERIALTLKNAGVSITLTSLTDIGAFSVGCLSSIPSLRSFCLYAVVGLSVLFIFQCTFFVACLAIDQKRLEERRNAFLFCIQYKEDKIPGSSTRSYDRGLIQMFFDKILSKYLLTKTSKVIVMISTAFLLASGIYGNVLLRQHSDALWFIPEDSYMVEFIRMFNKNYPKIGYPGLLVAHEMNWTESLPIFGELLEDLQESPHLHEIMQFYTSLKDFVMDVYEIDLSEQRLNEQQFHTYMGKFLWSPYGARYKYFFKLNDTFSCGESLPDIKTAIVPFHFKRFIDGSYEHLTGMNTIKGLVRNTSRDVTFNKNSADEGRLFFWAQISIAWEVDEIIKGEMYKNLALSMGCVMLAILLLLANIKMCLHCGVCVIITVIDVSGFMHFWGLSVDAVACTILVLAVGLCVDYAAHICLAFMESRKGSKTERAQDALRTIGPAVFNGGFSTFLGVILLVNARTVAAFSFFKIFSLVVAFGLFHGLIFLPVLLSLFGSEPSLLEKKVRHERKSGENNCSKLLEMHSLAEGGQLEEMAPDLDQYDTTDVKSSLKNGYPLLTRPSL